MITDSHVSEYIQSLSSDLPKAFASLEQRAKENHVPIIRKEAQNLLCFLLHEHQPKNILEIGTAIGFSSCLMAATTPQSTKITTIEKVEKRLVEAKKNIEAMGQKDRITLLEGDALEILSTLEGPYDFIFLDAAKGQYMNFFPQLVRLLADGGILLTDNVLQDGTIAQSKFTIERRDRTIHMRMRQFLYTITHDKRLETVVLPVADGMAISRRIE